jgi:geranylgeranyl pyrophosphate synthase
MLSAVNNKFQTPGDLEIGKAMLQATEGIERADQLSIIHINEAMKALSKVTSYEDQNLQALLELSVQVKTRKH